MTIQCIITCLLCRQKNSHFYSLYLTNEHHFLFGGHVEFLNLKIIWPFNVSSLVYYINKKPDISIHFISQTSITSCLVAILKFRICKLIWLFNASSRAYYISGKSDNSIHFISKTSITSCLAAILIFEIGKTYCILFVTLQNPRDTFFNNILSLPRLAMMNAIFDL